ncbi:peptide ABC transporter substrate-binding protein [Pseudomonas sp. dw_358]|uniref:peptide ABC transporter substrate-binding protein n=1 Tax=Pseudomonas sp. dw_358 TaxID=2720083 RepID=UPI001BD619D4|nr:peptide ABC transporter substrate-binding protein [Pseudomonas sp. dw_358]
MTEKTPDSLLNPTRRQALTLMGWAGLAGLGGAGSVFTGLLGASEAFAADAKTLNKQMVIGFSQEPTVFNPHLLHIEVDEGIYYGVFDPLFRVTPDGTFEPMLAVEVPTVANGGISADGLQWKIKLRDGVTWHDGKPFTANDVKFTLDLLVDPKFRSWRRTGHELVRDLKVVSPTELTWRMDKPFAPYAAILSDTFIVPEHLLGPVEDKNSAPFNNAPIGTGPFKWSRRVAGDFIELTANTQYFGKGPYLEKMIFKYIPDLTVLYTQFNTGDIDVAGLQWITLDHYEEAKKLPGKTVTAFNASTVETFAFNLGKPQFKDLAVREALYMAVDKATILSALYYGLPSPTETYIPLQSYYHNPDLPKHEFNVAKANAKLDEAGWKKGADGIRAKDGVRLAFSNSTTAGNHLREQMQQFLQQSFKDIGVDMSISNLPPAVMWGDFWMMSQFESSVVGLDFLTAADPDTSDYFRSTAVPAKGGSGQNTWQYQSPEVDALLTEGAQQFAPETRRATYFKLQEVVRRDLPFLPLFPFTEVRGHKVGIDGVIPNVNVRIDTWNVADWRWS